MIAALILVAFAIAIVVVIGKLRDWLNHRDADAEQWLAEHPEWTLERGTHEFYLRRGLYAMEFGETIASAVAAAKRRIAAEEKARRVNERIAQLREQDDTA